MTIRCHERPIFSKIVIGSLGYVRVSFHAEDNPGEEGGGVCRRRADHRFALVGSIHFLFIGGEKSKMIAAAAAAAINDDG
jgi:hypothetical protein